jgi:hypothetical protein
VPERLHSSIAVDQIKEKLTKRQTGNGHKRTFCRFGAAIRLEPFAITGPSGVTGRTSIYYGAREVPSTTSFEVPFAR